ncbi:hypothetical protein [Cellulomonas sp. NPDC058312]|uniref:hypothetical protein n=1 Tax=Cellulomonas sp. NPDC058312 TaxID=3346441 RepID=UPI0036EB842A
MLETDSVAGRFLTNPGKNLHDQALHVSDDLGSPIALVTQNTTVSDVWEYDPCGIACPTERSVTQAAGAHTRRCRRVRGGRCAIRTLMLMTVRASMCG